VAGDDVVFWGGRELVANTRIAILSLSVRSKKEAVQLGLGQCFTGIEVKPWWDVEFCSKWAFSSTGLVSDWHFYRDVKKALATKQYYTKNNALLLKRPAIHAEALFQGMVSEQVSGLVEDLFYYRVLSLNGRLVNNRETLAYFNDRLRFEFSSEDTGYSDEDAINERLGLSIINLLQVLDSGVLSF